MRSIEHLIEAIQREAERADFPIDAPVYERAGKDPARPILFAGSLKAAVCFFGRDLGKDEVALGEPLVGAAGKMVRRGVLEVFAKEPPPKSDKTLEAALNYVMLTNTVPYKPPGNKAYTSSVKERFRPFIAELLAIHWKGNYVVTLGTEAFTWFAPYADPDTVEAFWEREDRYESDFPCELVFETGGKTHRKQVTLGPLPHPSPLNQRWYSRFPALLEKRLAQVA